MTYICIYSESAHKVEFAKTIKDGAKIKDEVRIAKGDEHMADLPLVEYEKKRFDGECRCRGGDWKVYCGDVAFAWPKKSVKAGEETK